MKADNVREQPKLTVFVPVHTTTPGNSRRHWRVEAKAAKLQRNSTYFAVMAERKSLPAFPVKVVMTRVGRRVDQHNLGGCLKHCIDGVADAYGVDDGDRRWQFEFKQEVGKTYGVRIEIHALDDAGATIER